MERQNRSGKETEKETRVRLVEAATELFARRGFAGVSIRELAQAAQVNSASISYYFGGKDGLYAAVLEDQFMGVIRLLDAIRNEERGPEERLRHYGKMVCAIHHDNPHLLRLLQGELFNPGAGFETIASKFIPQLYRFLGDTVREGIDKELFRADLDPGCAALALAGILNFFFIVHPIAQRIMPPDVVDEGYVQQALEIYLRGVRRDDQ